MANNTQPKSGLINNWTGGIAQGSKTGYLGSFQDGVGIDYQTDPDYITALPQLIKDSSSNIADLVKWILTDGTNDYMYGDTGKIYKRASNGTYSNPKTVSNSHGNGIELFNNELWYLSDSSLGKTTDGIVTYNDDYFVTPLNDAPDIAQVFSANTYTPPVAISETAANKFTWTPTIKNMVDLELNIIAKGTGDWTITIHDVSNNVIGTLTATNANLANVIIRFNIGYLALTAGNAYHFHVTSTVADGTLRTNTAADLSTAETAIFIQSKDFDIDQKNVFTFTNNTAQLTNSYNAITTFTESATNKCSFTPVYSTLKSIALNVRTKNTGDLQIIVHDPNNQVVGTATVVNASLKNRAVWQQFVFSSVLTIIPGLTYHFHLINVGGANNTVHTSVNADLSTLYFKTYFQVITSDTAYHPAKVFTNLLCIGNGQFLETVDDSEVMIPQAITFPLGERIRFLETIGDYLAIATWKGTLDDGKSRIYFWDGTSPTFNSFVDIDGVVNTMKNDGANALFVLHGTQMNMSVYTGAITKVRRIKYIQNAIKSYVNPGAIDTLEGIMYFGNNGTTNSLIDSLVYSYGHKDKDFPMSLNKNFPISTGNKGTAITIGAILGKSADHFLVSWKDTTSGTVYGVDILDTNPQTSVYFTSLRLDRGYPERQKNCHDVSIRCFPIIAGQKITIEYRLNNITANGWTSLGTVGDTVAGNNIDVGIHYRNFNLDKLFFEIEFRVTLATTVAAPIFYQLAINDELLSNFRIEDQTT